MAEPTPDAYEADYIKTPGAVVHRDKNIAKGAVLAMLPMALISLIATIAVASGADPAAPAAAALVPGAWFAWTVYMMLTKVSVRTVLTDTTLEVHWGMSSSRVPIAAIREVKVPSSEGMVPQAAFAMKMWGPKGWVLVNYVDEAGEEKGMHFPAGDPEALVERIQKVRGTRVRVASDIDAEAEAEALAEAEAAVAEEREVAR